MSGIALTTPVARGTDPSVDISFVGINYDSAKVVISVSYQPSGIAQTFSFEGPALTALRTAVPNFAGLRVALLGYIQTLDATLGGSVT